MADWSKWVAVAFILLRDVVEISLTVIRKRMDKRMCSVYNLIIVMFLSYVLKIRICSSFCCICFE